MSNLKQIVPPLLAVEGLSVDIATRHGRIAAVQDMSIAVAPGEIVGIVGESGSGKSVSALAVMGILPDAAEVTGGRITFDGADLPLARRGRRDRDGLAIIFQNPRAALNPIRPVGRQIVDALRAHARLSRQHAVERAIELLEQVRIRDSARRFWSYPFELSGGMCQRVMIAIAIACEPRLLIADEPTTGLDVTTQKAIMDLVVELATGRGMATMLITHDLALAGERCTRMTVMQNGRVVEAGASSDILYRPRQPYTRSLVSATPMAPGRTHIASVRPPGGSEKPPLLAVENLSREYGLKSSRGLFQRTFMWRLRPHSESGNNIVRAVDSISLKIGFGESVGLVGESGSGKSTLASMIVRLIDPSAGRILFRGDEISATPARRFAVDSHRCDIQMVFQDPSASLNPRRTAFDAIAEPIRRLGRLEGSRSLREMVSELTEMVGLPFPLLSRLPHQLSGGEKARVGIARAIALRPGLLVLDEPTAALDVRVQAVVLKLLSDLRRELGLTYLFVSHDLAVVQEICDRVLVMQSGQIVDEGPTEKLLTKPSHPYTRSLVKAIPRLSSDFVPGSQQAAQMHESPRQAFALKNNQNQRNQPIK